MHAYAGEELKKQGIRAQIMQMETEGIARKNQLLDESTRLKQELFSGKSLSNITGKEYDVTGTLEGKFRQKLTGGQQASDQSSSPTQNSPQSLSPEQTTIVQTEGKAAGLPDKYLSAITAVEGGPKGMDAVNPVSNAFGPYQFLPSTAKQYGVTPQSSFEEQTKAYVQYTNDNKTRLKQLNGGREPNAQELYLAQFLGADGSFKAINRPTENAVDVLGKKAVEANRGNANMTVAEFIRPHLDKFNSAYSGNQSAAALALTGDPAKDKNSVWERHNKNKGAPTVAPGTASAATIPTETSPAPGRAGGQKIVVQNHPPASPGEIFKQALGKTGGFLAEAWENKPRTAAFEDRAKKAADNLKTLSTAEQKKLLKEYEDSYPDFANLVAKILAESKKAKS
jgi:hypothetical protein